MCKVGLFYLRVSWCLALVGCHPFPFASNDGNPSAIHPRWHLEDRAAVARCLEGYSLSDGVGVEQTAPGRLRKITIEEKLAGLGARAREDGKLVDGSGKEIRFFAHYTGGAQLPASCFAAEREALEELKKHYTVIEISYWPGKENGAPSPP
jgi:hypothetical protein